MAYRQHSNCRRVTLLITSRLFKFCRCLGVLLLLAWVPITDSMEVSDAIQDDLIHPTLFCCSRFFLLLFFFFFFFFFFLLLLLLLLLLLFLSHRRNLSCWYLQ